MPFHATRGFLVKHSFLRRVGRLIPSSAPKPDRGSPRTKVLSALEDGRRDPMVAAIKAIGLDPGDYTNNAARSGALRDWLAQDEAAD